MDGPPHDPHSQAYWTAPPGMQPSEQGSTRKDEPELQLQSVSAWIGVGAWHVSYSTHLAIFSKGPDLPAPVMQLQTILCALL